MIDVESTSFFGAEPNDEQLSYACIWSFLCLVGMLPHVFGCWRQNPEAELRAFGILILLGCLVLSVLGIAVVLPRFVYGSVVVGMLCLVNSVLAHLFSMYALEFLYIVVFLASGTTLIKRHREEMEKEKQESLQ